MRAREALSALLGLVVACNSVPAKSPKRDGGTIRYRLLLRDNPVSPTDAARCFSACQPEPTPNAYVDCLVACPGFEATPDEVCSKHDVPPEAACLTVRKVPFKKEMPPGLVVLAVVGQVALVVGAVSLCNVSSSQCGMQLPPPR
jgi:hypothetical protein